MQHIRMTTPPFFPKILSDVKVDPGSKEIQIL